MDKVVSLIQDYIPGIGKKSSSGAGQIGNIYIEEIDDDLSWITSSGLPARPLPESLWKEISNSEQDTCTMTVDVPYSSGKLVSAVFPLVI